MKTQKFTFQRLRAGLLALFMIIVLAFPACEKEEFNFATEKPEIFSIGPEGGIILAQNTEVFLRVPEGAVAAPAKIIISHKRGVKYESNILMNKCYSISLVDQQLLKPITIWLSYSPKELCMGTKDEHCLKIYAFDMSNNSGTFFDSDCFESVEDCCVDPKSKTVQGCFSELGNFIVGRIN